MSTTFADPAIADAYLTAAPDGSGFGYLSAENYQSPYIVFDKPYGTTLRTCASGGTGYLCPGSPTETIALTPGVPPGTLDNGPYYSAVRSIPGRPPVGLMPAGGDMIGFYRFDGQSDANTADTEYAGILGRIGRTGSAPIGVLALATANGNGNKGLSPAMFCAQGCYMADPFGSGSAGVATDPGWGNFAGTNFTFAGGTLTSGSVTETELDLINTSFGGSSWHIQSVGSNGSGHIGNLELLNNSLGLLITPVGGGAISAGLGVGFGSSTASIPTSGVVNAASGYQINGRALATTDLSDVTGATSWTPSLTFGGGNTGMTCSSCTGVYAQMGKLVVASFSISLSAKGSSIGVAIVTLPVATSSVAPSSGVCSNYSNMGVSVASTITLNSQSAADIELTVPSAGTMSPLSDTAFTNTSNLQCSITYVAT